jgi:hypothetical protein
MGKCIIWDSGQETPNIQYLEFEYGDGSTIQFDVWGLAPNPEGGIRIGNLIFGSKGWMKMESEDVGGLRHIWAISGCCPSAFPPMKKPQIPPLPMRILPPAMQW